MPLTFLDGDQSYRWFSAVDIEQGQIPSWSWSGRRPPRAEDCLPKTSIYPTRSSSPQQANICSAPRSGQVGTAEVSSPRCKSDINLAFLLSSLAASIRSVQERRGRSGPVPCGRKYRTEACAQEKEEGKESRVPISVDGAPCGRGQAPSSEGVPFWASPAKYSCCLLICWLISLLYYCQR